MVRAEGVEPPRLASLETKSSASTSSATPAATFKTPARLAIRVALYSNGFGGMQQKSSPLPR